MSLFLAQPFHVRYHVRSDMPHSTWEKLNQQRSDVEGSIKGVISDSPTGALTQLFANARKWASNVMNVNPGLMLSDLELVYCVTETDELGNIWTGRGLSSSARLTEVD